MKKVLVSASSLPMLSATLDWEDLKYYCQNVYDTLRESIVGIFVKQKLISKSEANRVLYDPELDYVMKATSSRFESVLQTLNKMGFKVIKESDDVGDDFEEFDENYEKYYTLKKGHFLVMLAFSNAKKIMHFNVKPDWSYIVKIGKKLLTQELFNGDDEEAFNDALEKITSKIWKESKIR